MIFTVYNSIEIQRLVEDVSWKKSYQTTIANNIKCYIEPLSEDVSIWIDWIWAYEWHKLFSTYTDIIIWDKIIDKDWTEYKVKWIKKFNSIVGKHIEAIIQTKYD